MIFNIHFCYRQRVFHYWQRVLLAILYISGIFVLDFVWWKDNPFSIKAYSAPSSGQIVVDPDNPAWFKYYQGGPFFMCGPGDPEGFLYRGTMNPDGTRNGDQLALINKLKGTGANSIYLMAVRSHGGDGDATQNPFINNDPAQGINEAVLNQWEAWFTEMDDNKITIFFIFYDDGTGIWGLDDSGNLQTEETNFIQTLVERFKHHKHLIWAVSEEYEEMDLGKPFANRNSQLHVSKIAEAIRMADTRGHPIAVHQQNGLTFAFPDDPNVDQFAVQHSTDSPWQFHSAMVSAWDDAAGRYSLNLAEYHPTATGVTARKNSWAIAMGGAYVMHLGWDIENNTMSDLRDCGRLVSFMESTNFNEMSPHNELKHADTEYVLAVPGSSYIAYTSSSSSGEIGLRNMTAGVYDFRWFSPEDGTTVIETDINVAAGTNSWPKPSSLGAEVVVYIKRTGPAPSPLPTLTSNLSVTKVDSPDPVIEGSNLTYTITVTNNGPDDATGVTVTNLLPSSGVTFVSASPDCNQSGNMVTCILNSLTNGANATFDIVIIPTISGTITNYANVTGNESDPDQANNTVGEDTTVEPAPTPTPTPTPTLTSEPTPTPAPVPTPVPGIIELSAVKDTYVVKAYPNKSSGTATFLEIRGSSEFTKEVLVQFNLSGIPEGAEVIRAHLMLYSESSQGFKASKNAAVYANLSSWTKSVTWNTKPLRASSFERSIAVTTTGEYYSWDITGLVQDWVDGIETNHGIAVVSEGTGHLYFSSREASSNNPILLVEYTVPTPTHQH